MVLDGFRSSSIQGVDSSGYPVACGDKAAAQELPPVFSAAAVFGPPP